MQVFKVISAAALTSLIAVSANADEYDSVVQGRSIAARSDVRAEAEAAARLPDPYTESAQSGPPNAMVSVIDRQTVRTQARAAARAGNLYGEAWSPGAMPRDSNLARIEGTQRAW